LDGIIEAEDVTILETGKIIGTMQYTNLVIEKNGIFQGQSNVKNSMLTSKYATIDETQFQHLIEDITKESEGYEEDK
jgi:cytoskeletal protein CcmA (bactofilin family)